MIKIVIALVLIVSSLITATVLRLAGVEGDYTLGGIACFFGIGILVGTVWGEDE